MFSPSVAYFVPVTVSAGSGADLLRRGLFGFGVAAILSTGGRLSVPRLRLLRSAGSSRSATTRQMPSRLDAGYAIWASYLA